MNAQDFEFIAALVKTRIGVSLTADKLYLLESRLAPLARKEGLPSIGDLIAVVRNRREERLIAQVIDVMTASETFFFRDRVPFAHLKESILPQLASARRGGRVRIWCAGCSTGQEPYSIAMMLDQNPDLTQGVPVEIAATDVSDRVLEKARAGLYSQFEVQRGLPIQMLMNYFTQQDDHWRIADRLRANVAFRKHNLLEPSLLPGPFDIIFCRNVLSSFDPPTRGEALNRLSLQLHPQGLVVLGNGESAAGAFEAVPERRGVFRLAQGASKAA